MGVFNKLKNILFEDVDDEEFVNDKHVEKHIEEPIIEKKEEPKIVTKDVMPKHVEEVSRFRSINYEDNIEKEPVIEKKEETSPFQQFDEEEFDRIATINKNKLIERDKKLREEKMALEHRKVEKKKEVSVKKEVKLEQLAPKKFIPSPVISPVYGILDKNYKKEDILPRASSDGTLPKIADIDIVRDKAYGIIDDEEPIIEEEVKITSFDDEDIDEVNEEPVIENNDIEDIVDEEVNNNEEDVVDNDVIYDKEVNNDEDDELESDLFNLIDSMYQDEEE